MTGLQNAIYDGTDLCSKRGLMNLSFESIELPSSLAHLEPAPRVAGGGAMISGGDGLRPNFPKSVTV